VISDTLVLSPDTVLIGLHPLSTQLDLLDRTEAFQGTGLQADGRGAEGGRERPHRHRSLHQRLNPRSASQPQWMAGARSMMKHVRFLGGHGTVNLDGTRAQPLQQQPDGDPTSTGAGRTVPEPLGD